MYIDVKQAAIKWNISERRVRTLCLQGKIDGAYQIEHILKVQLDVELKIKPLLNQLHIQ